MLLINERELKKKKKNPTQEQEKVEPQLEDKRLSHAEVEHNWKQFEDQIWPFVTEDVAEVSLWFGCVATRERGWKYPVSALCGPRAHTFTHTQPHTRTSLCQEIIKSKNKSAVLGCFMHYYSPQEAEPQV